MRIIFVRHGHPNYEIDCLTELGHLQAEAAAERLKDEPIDRFFASSCGRAVETAEHIASRHNNMPVQQCDFIRELAWGCKDGDKIDYKWTPWSFARELIARGETLMQPDWMEHPILENNLLHQSVPRVIKGLDEWLEVLGYVREGEYYRVKEKNDQTILMASHAGASSAVMSHLFNLPFPYVCKAIQPKCTAVTIVTFNGENGELIAPMFELMNDARHIAGIEVKNVFGN